MIITGCRSSAYQYASQGEQLYEVGKYDRAVTEFRMAIRYRPDDPNLLYSLGLCYVKQGMLNPAHDTFERLLKLDPRFRPQVISGYYELAQTHQTSHAASTFLALEAIARLDADFPFGASAYDLGRGYYERNDFPKALLYLQMALPALPSDSLVTQTHYLIAVSYQKVQEYVRAIDHFVLVDEAKLDPGLRADYLFQAGETAFRLAQESYQQGADSTALMAINVLLQMGQPSALIDRAYYLQGRVLQNMGRGEEAIVSLERVIYLNPDQRGRLVDEARLDIQALRSGQPRQVQPDSTFVLDSLEF